MQEKLDIQEFGIEMCLDLHTLFLQHSDHFKLKGDLTI